MEDLPLSISRPDYATNLSGDSPSLTHVPFLLVGVGELVGGVVDPGVERCLGFVLPALVDGDGGFDRVA